MTDSSPSGSSLARIFGLAAWPAVLSLGVTLLRFAAERSELPSVVPFLLGIFWLTLIVAVYWAWRLRKEAAPYRLLFGALLAFAILSRIPVVALWFVARRYDLGTHYDMYRTLSQAVLFQFGVSASVQVAAGFLLGGAALARFRRKASRKERGSANARI
jgi:hypothetical protein